MSKDLSLLCSGIPKQDAFNGPNGIVIYTDASSKNWLIIAISPSRLVKMDMVTGLGSVVLPGLSTAKTNALLLLDGIAIYSKGLPAGVSVIYATGGVQPQGTIQVISSVDQWKTYELRSVINANCVQGSSCYNPAVRLAGDAIVTLCNNNFVPGTNTIYYSTISNIGSKLPIAIQSQIIDFPYLSPENFDYFPITNMLVFGSLAGGAIRGVPYNPLYSTVVTNSPASVSTFIPSGLGGIFSTMGIKIADNTVGPCYAFVCQGALGENNDNIDIVNIYCSIKSKS